MKIITTVLFLLTLPNTHAFLSKPIPRLNAPTLRVFMENYAMKGIPVIITNYSDVFKNMTEQNIIENSIKIYLRMFLGPY